MNDEQPTNDAEQKPGKLTESIERMKKVLDEVESEIRAARFLFPNLESEGVKWATLSRACGKIHDLTRLGWQSLVETQPHDPAAGTGAFFTQKEVLDAVMANPPLNIKPTAEPIQPGTPKIVQGEQSWRAIKTDSVGIIRHDGTVRGWAIRENAGVKVFAKQIHADGKFTDCWTFTGTVDCEKVIVGSIFAGRNKANAIVKFIRNGLLASRLRMRHKRMNKKAKAAANENGGGVPHV